MDGARLLLDNLLVLNSSIIAFGLVNPKGQLYITSSNLKYVTKLPNLLKMSQTKETFMYTLNSKMIVLGRTYFYKPLNTLG